MSVDLGELQHFNLKIWYKKSGCLKQVLLSLNTMYPVELFTINEKQEISMNTLRCSLMHLIK